MQKLRRSECAVLPLVLNGEWYDMIASGEKREEYRDDKPYWNTRISRWFIEGLAKVHHVIAFSRGYVRPTMFFRVGALVRVPRRIKHPEWGEPTSSHWVIGLGERVELEEEAPNGKA
jgi:hypothetical protein